MLVLFIKRQKVLCPNTDGFWVLIVLSCLSGFMESVDTSMGCSVGEEKTGVTSFGSERPSNVGAVDVITLHIG